MNVTTNNVPRDILDAHDLTPRERARLDYHDWDALDEGRDSASFFRYHGEVYDLGNFMRIDDQDGPLAGWHGAEGDSYFSGTVMRYVEDGYDTRVVVGRYYA